MFRKTPDEREVTAVPCPPSVQPAALCNEVGCDFAGIATRGGDLSCRERSHRPGTDLLGGALVAPLERRWDTLLLDPSSQSPKDGEAQAFAIGVAPAAREQERKFIVNDGVGNVRFSKEQADLVGDGGLSNTNGPGYRYDRCAHVSPSLSQNPACWAGRVIRPGAELESRRAAPSRVGRRSSLHPEDAPARGRCLPPFVDCPEPPADRVVDRLLLRVIVWSGSPVSMFALLAPIALVAAIVGFPVGFVLGRFAPLPLLLIPAAVVWAPTASWLIALAITANPIWGWWITALGGAGGTIGVWIGGSFGNKARDDHVSRGSLPPPLPRRAPD